MSFIDRLMGRNTAPRGRGRSSTELGDEQAIERYRYMLRTAPPEDIERAHEEAFAALSADQRATVLRELSAQLPPSERAPNADPRSLARMATRAEIRQPGIMERTFAAVPAGPGLGSMFLTSLAGAFVGTAIADSFFNNDAAFAGDIAGVVAGGDDAAADDAGTFGDPDLSGGGSFDEPGGGEIEADLGDLGGDFGGGDF